MGLSVYIHVPYCLKRCPYCDFNTYAVGQVPEDDYVSALLRELDATAKRPPWEGRRVATVFFGGGTPSLLAPDSIDRLLDRLDARFGIQADAEISLEANPGSLEGSAPERLAELRKAGVNRLSIGAQSFDDRHLATLGRIHRAGDTLETLAAARRAGFDNLSLDLIFAVPGQTIADWQRDLERVVALAPEHVSAYGLTYEEGTPLERDLAAGNVEPATEETEAAMYEAAISTLAGAGYRHYEISNFARPGYQCRHNVTYWSWGDYLGLGAGAHGFYRCTSGPVVQERRRRDPQENTEHAGRRVRTQDDAHTGTDLVGGGPHHGSRSNGGCIGNARSFPQRVHHEAGRPGGAIHRGAGGSGEDTAAATSPYHGIDHGDCAGNAAPRERRQAAGAEAVGPAPRELSVERDEDRPWAVRYANVRSPSAYMAAAPGRTVESAETISRATAMSEFILLGLRLIDGLPLVRFKHVFGTELDCTSPSYRFLTSSGFLERENGHLRLTRRGLLLADSVIARLAAG